MASTDAAVNHAVSRDGTKLGYFTSGQGAQQLLLVHPALGDHTRWEPLLPHLEPHVTVHAMDRRGRGASGDHPDYQLEREYEDVAAVVDAIATEADTPVDVYGASSGGYYAFGAATLTSSIRSLVLYEGWPLVDPEAMTPPSELLARLEGLLAAGKPEAALEMVYREYLQMTDEEVAEVRSQPSWPARVAAAHTIPREARPGSGPKLNPEQAARLAVPVLLLVGEDSPEHLRAGAEPVAAAVPDARIAVLEGQGHAADLLAPEAVAEAILPFLREPR